MLLRKKWKSKNKLLILWWYNKLLSKIVEYELENPGMDLSDDLTEEYRLIVKEYSRYNEEK